MNREHIYSFIQQKLEDEIQLIDQSLVEILEGIANETKSSAGDKYETSREMAQQELQQLEVNKTLKRNQLLSILQLRNIEVSELVKSGSIIATNQGYFLLGSAIGKIVLDNGEIIFALGLQSPLSQQLLGKSKGDSFQLNNTNYLIQELY